MTFYEAVFLEGDYRTTPVSLHEKIFLHSVKSGYGGAVLRDNKTGEPIIHTGGPPGSKKALRKGYVKGQAVHRAPDGKNITIHYWEHPKSGERIDLKFK